MLFRSERLTSETDSRKRADAEAVAWKFKYEKAELEKLYAQTHQKTVEVAVEKKSALFIIIISQRVSTLFMYY